MNPEDYKKRITETPEQYNQRIASLRGDTPTNTANMQDLTKTATGSDFTRLPGESIADMALRADGKTAPVQDTTVANPPAQTSDEIRVAERKKEIERIKAELESANKSPELYKASEEFTKLRNEQGVVKDEEELASIRNEARLGKEELRKFNQTAGQGVTEQGRIGAVSEAERNLNFRIGGLALREQAVLDRINSKNAYIDSVIKLGQQDYNTAYQEYTNEFNKNVKAVDLYNSQLDNDKKDAMAALTTISNLYKDKGTVLDPSLKTQINTLELKAGLPSGIFESALEAMPEEKILAPITVDNDSGGKDIYFFTQGTDGTPHLRQSITLGGGGGNMSDMGSIGNIPISSFRNAYESAAIGLSAQARKKVDAQFNKLLQQGNPDAIKEFLVRTATETLGADQQSQAIGRLTAIESMKNIQELLSDPSVSTNLVKGNLELTAQKLGLSSDPKLAYIGNQIAQTLQVYRRAMTGVAFNPGESAEYAKIFPQITDIGGLAGTKLQSLLDSFERNQRVVLSQQMGATAYNDIFGKNVNRIELPEANTPEEKTKALDSILNAGNIVSSLPSIEENPDSFFSRFLNIINPFD